MHDLSSTPGFQGRHFRNSCCFFDQFRSRRTPPPLNTERKLHFWPFLRKGLSNLTCSISAVPRSFASMDDMRRPSDLRSSEVRWTLGARLLGAVICDRRQFPAELRRDLKGPPAQSADPLRDRRPGFSGSSAGIFEIFGSAGSIRNLSRSIGLVAQIVLHQKSALETHFKAISWPFYFLIPGTGPRALLVRPILWPEPQG